MPLQIKINQELIPSVRDLEFSIPIGVSVLGTLVYDNILFPRYKYKNIKGIEFGFDDLILNSAQFTVNQAKNIVYTPMNGRDGTVKEYISNGDYVIDLTAYLTERYSVFPADQLETFSLIAGSGTAVPIVSKVLNSFFGINNVVVSSFSVNPRNVRGGMLVTMQLMSDTDFDFEEFSIL